MSYELENKHVRDQFISFEPTKHIYKVNNEEYISVTTVIHNYFPKFDPDKVIKKMMNSKNWSSSPYFGMSTESIKNKWNSNGKSAADSGTILHESIENYYLSNQKIISTDPFFNQFLKFHNDHKLSPYRTEWRIFSDDHKIAGSIDIVFCGSKEGIVKIYDWKKCKKIHFTNSYEHGLHPLEHFPHCNHSHYTLQLNIYKYILENYYGLFVEELAIIVFSEDNYQKIVLDDKQDDIKILLDHISLQNS
jgi:ATP-dependent exoDNAse (exonuclease V) beta subunit